MNVLVLSKFLRSDKILFYGCICSIIFLVISIGIILFVFSYLPPFVPLYNQLPWGEARLGTKLEFFLLPAMMSGVFLANTLFALYIYQKIPLLSRFFAVTCLLTGIFGLLFVIRTIRLIL